MSERGEYRAIHTVLIDGPDFQDLTPDERLAFLIVKLSLGPSGIDVMPALIPTLMERTGMDEARVTAALDGLERAGWLQRERNVLWIVKGLRYEPSLNVQNAKHRKGLLNHISGLPRLAIVRAFLMAYPGWFDDLDSLSIGYPGVEDSLSKQGKGKGRGKQKREKETSSPRDERAAATGGDEPPPPRSAAVESHADEAPRETWLTPALEAWERHKGPGSFRVKQAAGLFASLHKAGLSPEEIGRRLDRYCELRKGKFCTLADFAANHGEFVPPDPSTLYENGWMSAELERETRPPSVGARP